MKCRPVAQASRLPESCRWNACVTIEELIKYVQLRSRKLLKADPNELVALAYEGEWCLGRIDNKKVGNKCKVQYPLMQNVKKREALVEKSQIKYVFCEDPAEAPVLKKKATVP